jgi:hypothetical protein
VLDTVVGGAANTLEAYLTPQLALAYLPVSGWTMKDVFAKHTIGQ